jgi:hypothetical protein
MIVMIALVIVIAVHEMVIFHPVAATEALAKVGTLIARQIGMAEFVVVIRVGLPMRIDIVPGRVNAIAKPAMPCVGPGALGLHRFPAPLLRVERGGRAAYQCEAE